MHKISRIFAASLLAIGMYAQSEPEPCSRAHFEDIKVITHDSSLHTALPNYPDIKGKGFYIWCKQKPKEVAAVIILLAMITFMHTK